MKKLLILAVTAFFSLFSAANAQDQNPYEIANSVASTSLAKIKAAKGDKSALEKIIEEDLLPFIPVPRLFQKKTENALLMPLLFT